MSPRLQDGDYILTITPRFPGIRLKPGHIYVLNHPDLGRIVKRLQRVEGKCYYFSGDNKASTPDRLIAPVKRDRVLGKMLLRIRA